MIVAISHPDDPHALRVLEHLADAGHEAVLLDLSELPDRATLTVDYDRGSPRMEIGRDGGPPIDLGRAHAAWWRRPQAAEPSSVADPEVRLFTINEWHEAINGLWQLLDVHWVNDPVRDEVAARKALQLRLAAGLGLRVPRTLITSDPDRARAIRRRRGGRRDGVQDLLLHAHDLAGDQARGGGRALAARHRAPGSGDLPGVHPRGLRPPCHRRRHARVPGGDPLAGDGLPDRLSDEPRSGANRARDPAARARAAVAVVDGAARSRVRGNRPQAHTRTASTCSSK